MTYYDFYWLIICDILVVFVSFKAFADFWLPGSASLLRIRKARIKLIRIHITAKKYHKKDDILPPHQCLQGRGGR